MLTALAHVLTQYLCFSVDTINKNLLVLGKCIHAFRDGERMPYRECKLTLALMEYFKPNYKIYMVAHLNRSGQMFH